MRGNFCVGLLKQPGFEALAESVNQHSSVKTRISAIRYTMEVCNYLGIPKVNICTPSVVALQAFDHEKQASIALNFHKHV